MPLDPSYAGRSYPPTAPYEVGREKIREFARAIGAGDPAYHDVAAARALGHPDLLAPPTFPILFTWAAGYHLVKDPELGIDFGRVVHGEQRFSYTRPVYAGDQLVCTVVVEEVRSRAGHDFITTRTDVATEGGEPVLSGWTRLVVRGGA
ncbi:MAG TPA: MaoC family dehydratase N-terminal domain-containing protein [Micromonosporaceae bacterium]|nr:MaoC family dehydratase N-terminal domain-containing protein [Micromonosporaceae bacterium]